MKRVTLTESVYLVINDALAANPKRRLRDFQWHFDAAVDATARFNDGWMAFKWSGIWQDYHSQIRNMEHLHRNLRAWRPGERPPLPGRMVHRAGRLAGRTGETRGLNVRAEGAVPDLQRNVRPDRGRLRPVAQSGAATEARYAAVGAGIRTAWTPSYGVC